MWVVKGVGGGLILSWGLLPKAATPSSHHPLEPRKIFVSSIFYILYLACAVCFIMALRGLSSPVSARNGNYYGMAGMALAVATTRCSCRR